LLHTYFCDFKTEVTEADRDAIDRALGEFLDKKFLYYGYNHSNQRLNSLKKATKNVHKKVNLIYSASKEDDENQVTALATVQSTGFQGYFYKASDPAGDPDELRWCFELGAKHRPLEKREINGYTPSNASASSGGNRQAARLAIKKKQQEEAAQKLADETKAQQLRAEEMKEARRLEKEKAEKRAEVLSQQQTNQSIVNNGISKLGKNSKPLAITPKQKTTKASAKKSSARKHLNFR
jgi:hypothetical protein